jgi:hypothetical protein
MSIDFQAAFVASTELMPDGESWIITLVGRDGTPKVLALTAAAAAVLQSALSSGPGNVQRNLTKRPKTFAVGTGQHQPVVMVRFEQDVPYSISASQAQMLGKELIQAATTVARQPAPTRQ